MGLFNALVALFRAALLSLSALAVVNASTTRYHSPATSKSFAGVNDYFLHGTSHEDQSRYVKTIASWGVKVVRLWGECCFISHKMIVGLNRQEFGLLRSRAARSLSSDVCNIKADLSIAYRQSATTYDLTESKNSNACAWYMPERQFNSQHLSP